MSRRTSPSPRRKAKSDPAAGDLVEVPHPRTGRPVRVTRLHAAALAGDAEKAALLLREGADPLALDELGGLDLAAVFAAGDMALFDVVFEAFPEWIRAEFAGGLFWDGVSRAHNVKTLPLAAADQALVEALAAGDYYGVTKALEAGANANARWRRLGGAFCRPALGAREPLAEEFLTPLLFVAGLPDTAAEGGGRAPAEPRLAVPIAEKLLEAGARPADRYRGFTPFELAVGRNLTLAKFLLPTAGAPDRVITLGRGAAARKTTLLALRAAAGDAPGVRLLLEEGASPDAAPVRAEPGFEAPLTLAARLGGARRAAGFEVAQLLAEAGADPFVVDASRETPFAAALGAGNARVAELLAPRYPEWYRAFARKRAARPRAPEHGCGVM